MTPAAVQARTPAGDRFEAHRARFERDGFVVIEGAVAREQAEGLGRRIVAAFEAARAGGALFSGGGLLAGHLNCSPGESARALHAALEDGGVVELVRSLFPAAVRAPYVGCNLNLPGSAVQHYHTDRPFTREFPILNVALVDTEVVNGAIDVVPGTHKRFYPFWRFELQRRRTPGIRVPLRAGDVLVRSSNLWHRGMPNRTATPRPMAAFTWEDGGCEEADPFGASSAIAFRPNWYRPSALGRLRERVYLAAPFSYDAFRIVRSLFSDKGYDH